MTKHKAYRLFDTLQTILTIAENSQDSVDYISVDLVEKSKGFDEVNNFCLEMFNTYIKTLEK